MSQVSVAPEQDARLPILEAQIEARWKKFLPEKYKSLEASGQLKSEAKNVALQCLSLMNQYQEKGFSPDQAREAIQPLIIPPQNE